MKKAIIMHGRPSEDQWRDPNFPSTSNYYWIPKLQKQLALNDVPTQTPEVPYAYRPHYPTWRETFEQFSIDEETILIGHSCGAGFLVRWLSENAVKVGKVILIAPWVDIAGDPDNEDTLEFMNFNIDSELAAKTKGLVIIHSSNDSGTIQRSVEKLRQQLNDIKYLELENRGHFYDDMTTELPELLEEVLA